MGQKKFASIVLLIVLVALLGIGGYFVRTKKQNGMRSPDLLASEISKEDISSWKTYRNEKYNFEFRHPANVKVGETTNTEVLAVVSTEPEADQVTDLSVAFNIFIETS